MVVERLRTERRSQQNSKRPLATDKTSVASLNYSLAILTTSIVSLRPAFWKIFLATLLLIVEGRPSILVDAKREVTPTANQSDTSSQEVLRAAIPLPLVSIVAASLVLRTP